MLASGVVALALFMLFGSLISVSFMGEVTESKADASITLDGTLEYTRTLEYEDMLEYVSPEIEGVGVKSVITLECFDADGDSVALPLTAPAGEELAIPALPNPLEIKATITWSDNAGRVYEAYASTQVER